MRWHERLASVLCAAVVMTLVSTSSRAQHQHHAPPVAKPDSAVKARRPIPRHAMPRPAADPHAGHAAAADHAAAMPAFYGPYPFAREASGTAWQPERSRHEGVHAMRGDWALMLHGFAYAIVTQQGGPRGEDMMFGSNMLMGMASRPLGGGRLGFRGMLSLEPATIGREGYPLLLQTGETADGLAELIDRQHPHDLFMELAGSWSVSSGASSAFLYAGLPGEPALGPPAFMHRVSGMLNPESPIAHHWLDSSHITFGVLTLGATHRGFKVEGSAFRGREPDHERWDIETPKLDSYSGRLSWNPAPSWSVQASGGRLEAPEQLEPDVNTERFTASAIWAGRIGARDAAAMLAWGRNRNRPGNTTDAVLLEGMAELGRHVVLARAERVEKDELFAEGDPREHDVFTVGRVEAGLLMSMARLTHLDLGVGGLASLSFVPRSLESVYGSTPLGGSLFLRAAIH